MDNDGSRSHNTGEALLRLLASRGISYFFVNSGTDFPTLVEALARASEEGFSIPRTLLIPHENVAVGMAYGVTLATGQAQAVMVHVNVGTANALCGVINAARENIPMLLAAGRTPWFEKGSPASRSLNIHWAQEMFDQAGMLREHVKWDYELRSAAQLEPVLDRALAIARSEPPGPVYLSLPREVLDQDSPLPGAQATQRAALPAIPNPSAVAEVARALAQARLPLIVTSRAGREHEAVGLLSDLATQWAWPVVEFRPRFLSLPSAHPMHGGHEVNPWLEQADFILVLDCDVPWIPSQKEPGPLVPVVHVASDPLFSRYPTRGFRADTCLQCSPAAFLRALRDALVDVVQDHAAIATRREQVVRAGVGRSQSIAERVRLGQHTEPMGMAAVSHALGQALGAHEGETVVVNEYSLVPAAMPWTRPGSYFGSSPVGGLGWGLPAALGIKLAQPDALVVAALGDGSYIFSNPLACHHTAAMHGIAVLTLVMDNGGYGAVERATRAMYPAGRATELGMPLVSLAPMPRFSEVVAACGGWGERVTSSEELPAALQRAIHQVTVQKRQALLHVLCA
ncbi:MAG: thiamine pyrophosphate-requiring protein [Burkholderiaceae bacterium]